MGPYLIVTCDDVGMHQSINECVNEAIEKKIITNVSIVANGSAFYEAVEILKKAKNISVGLHFNIIEGPPISDNQEKNTLLLGEHFYDDHVKFAKDLLVNKITQKDIQDELRAQLDLCLKSGLHISHIDGHRHLHLFPFVFKSILPVLKEYNINKIRYVNTPFFEIDFSNPVKIFSNIIFKYTRLKYGVLNGPDYFLGFYNSGNINSNRLNNWIYNLKSNLIYEIGFHLGKSDELLNQSFDWNRYYKYNFSWEGEMECLFSDDIENNLFKNKNITLINYNEL